MAFIKAQKSQINPTVVIEGPTGSGKTYTALSIASGMGKKIAVIDTERSSSAYYADRFAFDVCELHSWSTESYLAAAREAAGAGYEVLIIDSASHAWKQLTEDMEDAAAKYRGNSMTAWTKDGKPQWNRFVDELFSLGMAVIVTTRVRQAYDIGKDDAGRTKIEKLGLEAQAEKDFDYEFGIILRMDQDHNALITKDRTGKFQDKLIKRPGETFGAELVAWLNSGVPLPPPPPKVHELTEEEREAAKAELQELITALGETMTASVGAVAAFTEERRKVYRDRKAAADIKGRGVGALADMRQVVSDAEAELIKLRADWEAAGSPTPRPAVLVPKEEPSTQTESPAAVVPTAAPAKPGPQTDLSPAAQKVVLIAGVMVPPNERVEAVGATAVAESEELGLF